MKAKQISLSILLCLLPILLGLILWNQLPEQIPIQFNSAQQVNTYAPKALAIFGLPVFFAAVDAFALFGIKTDPKANRHTKLFRVIGLWICPFLCNLVLPILFFISMGANIPIVLILSILLGLFIVILGNFLPKCPQNYTIGIKLPWTLHDEENWNYTHRLAGFVWVIGGILMIINAFFQWLLITILLLVLLFALPILFSYLHYRRTQKG